jgi:CHAT domain-containing protein
MRYPHRLCGLLLVALIGFSLLPAALAQETQEARTLEPGKPLERELAGGQSHTYRLTLAADQYLQLVVEQRGVDVVVVVVGPDDRKLAEVDSPNGTQGPEPVSLVAEAPGSYRVEVRSLEKAAQTGRYEIKLQEIRQATLQDRQRQAAGKIYAEAERLREQGTAASQRQALEKYGEALPLWRAVGNRAREASALYLIGYVNAALGEPRRALEYYNQALPVYRAVGDQGEEATTLQSLGASHYLLGESRQSLDYLTQALALHRKLGNRGGEASALNSIGGVYRDLGDLPKALDYFGQSLPLRRAAGDRRGEGITLNSIAATNSDLGNKQKALDSFNQALARFQAINDRREQAIILSNIGSLYLSLGEKDRALDYLGQSLALRRAVGDRRGEAFTLQTIGRAYDGLGERQKALDHFNQALALFQAVGDPNGQAAALNSLGVTHSAAGEKQKALGFFERAAQLAQTLGNRRGEAYTLTNIGLIQDFLGEKQKALDYYRQSLALFQAAGDREAEARSTYYVARIERDQGNLDAAWARLETALGLIESLRTEVSSQELRASYFASRQDYYQFGVDLLMRMHKSQPAQNFNALALQTNERARARSLLETLSEARADIRQGLDASLLERERELQQQLNRKEQLRMQLLSRKHTPEQAAAAEKELRELTTQYQDLRTHIKTGNPRYAALTQPQPLTLAEIQQQVLDADTLLLEYSLGEERSYLWAVSQEAIASFELPKRAEVEAAARGFYDALVAFNQPSRRANANAPRSMAPAKPLEAGAALSRMLLAPVAAQLGGKRLLIVADGALQYVPFAALPSPLGGAESRVSRPALRGQSRGSQNAKPETQAPAPLIVNHEIISLPSASSLAVLRRELAGRKAAAKAVAVFADPVFSADDSRLQGQAGPKAETPVAATNETRELEQPLTRSAREAGVADAGLRIPRLFGTSREAAAIAALVPEAERKQALNFDANRATATSEELSQYRIVHFATHGLLNSTHPELSGIVLSLVDREGKPQDGFLRMHEIYNLKLPAELVVLSACQTGLGKDIKGEGLVGLTRGFMYAGAARVMASLWKVDDVATPELMKRFYQSMVKDGLRPAAALRAAQIAMWKQRRWQEPYYWAAFALQGEWK